MPGIPSFLYHRSFVLRDPTLQTAALGYNAYAVTVTFEDALVKGFFLTEFMATLIIYDDNAGGNPIIISEATGQLDHYCFVRTNPPNLGDIGSGSNVTFFPAGPYTRDVFSYRLNQLYTFAKGIYYPGNSIRWEPGFIIDAGFVPVGNIKYFLTLYFELGFGFDPTGSTTNPIIDWDRIEDPRIAESFK